MSSPEAPVRRAPYAAYPQRSRGRRHPEAPPGLRSEYQRDRDRVVHSAAFRRLEYKTQVFVNHEGDMFRTRLTHSIEVAQIARSIARALALDEDLTEAIALAHDLGHTPFGHAGQEALDRCMRGHGGFEHNLQSLRVVDVLEERYAAFRGLNLTYETREGILKHCPKAIAGGLGELGRRFLDGGQPSLEAQVANVADEIAYNNHDLDDGLRAGLLEVEEMRELALFRRHHDRVLAAWPRLAARRVIHEVVRRMVDDEVTALVAATRERLREAAPASIAEVRSVASPLVGFDAEAGERHREFKRFLHRRLYRHYRVHRMSRKAERIISDLFACLIADPRLLPPDDQAWARELEQRDGPNGRARAVADYIAGMTDRYAITEHGRLFDAVRLT